jgi:hypothetical protein
VQEEFLTFEEESSQAVAANDATAIGRFVADDWVIVDADGSVIDRPRFIGLIDRASWLTNRWSQPTSRFASTEIPR